MTWEKSRKRWRKMYRGQIYTISPKELRCSSSKEESREAANQWWRAKQAEVDGRLNNPLQQAIRQTQEETGLVDGNGKLTWKGHAVLFHGPADVQDALIVRIAEKLRTIDGTTAQEKMIEQKVAEMIGLPGPLEENSVGVQAEAWKAGQDKKVGLGEITAGRAGKNKELLGKFVAWLGEGTTVAAINENTWENFHTWLAGEKAYAKEYKKRIWQYAGSFLKYLHDKRLLELPRNFKSLGFKIKNKARKIAVLSIDQVKQVVASATGQTRLHVLLMLNCGFEPMDISKLQDEVVDWKAGTIRQKRGKTEDFEEVPEVTYKLWPETFSLLKEYRSGDGRVLLTQTGKPWITERTKEDGKYVRSVAISSNFRNLKKQSKVNVYPLILRRTSATTLGSHPQFKFYAQYFLGHSPGSIADRNYVAPSDNEFFIALKWLGKQYGLGNVSRFTP